jgi:hypothetical protein
MCILETAVSYYVRWCYLLSKIICSGTGSLISNSEKFCYLPTPHIQPPVHWIRAGITGLRESKFWNYSRSNLRIFGPQPNFLCKYVICTRLGRITISFYSSPNKTLPTNNVLWPACCHLTFLLMLLRQHSLNELFKDALRTRNILWSFCEVVHSVRCIKLIASSIFQPNVHYIFATYIFYQISPSCFSVLCTILSKNFIYLLKIVIFLQGCYIRCVIKYKIYIFHILHPAFEDGPDRGFRNVGKT